MLLPLGLGKSKLSSAGAKPLGKTACEPPPVGWIKVNFDGSFVAQDGKAGAGVQPVRFAVFFWLIQCSS